MTVELIQTEDAGRTIRCTGCGYHGVPDYIDDKAILRCPYCPKEEPTRLIGLPRRHEGPARNAPCPCGSGEKSKKCCWR